MAFEHEIRYCFPDGKSKALVMSYDDGSEHDRQLVELFNRHGIRGTFHLNSGKLGEQHHISGDEVGLLYRGHEVSSHTLSHADLTQLSGRDIRRELLDDKTALEGLTGKAVRGLAYPFGKYDARIVSMLPELGIEYARTVLSTNDFNISENWLRCETTCHHNLAMDMGRRFLDIDDNVMRLMYVWGHSYELDGFMTEDGSKNWLYMEQFCRLMQENPQIHYATTIEIVDYLQAIKGLRFFHGGPAVQNTSHVPVWLTWRGATVSIPSGEKVDFGT